MSSFYIDAHCHLADPRLDSIRNDLLDRSRRAGVRAWIQGGVGPEDWERQKELKKQFPGEVHAVFGLHPWWIMDHERTEEIRQALQCLEEQIQECCAIGEIGLDFGSRASRTESRDRQLWSFEAQLEIASRIPKPLVLHVVRAHAEALSCLKKRQRVLDRGGIVHAFSGTPGIAKSYLDLGFSISLGGTVTKKSAESLELLKEMIAVIPEDRLLIESDAPDQAPAGWGRKLNEPISILRIADTIAVIRGETPDELLRRSAENAVRIFGC